MAAALTRTLTLVKARHILLQQNNAANSVWNATTAVLRRTAVTKSSGALLPEPTKDPLGLIGFSGTVLVGLTLGATISKHIASFLEENELFVPADDDDDD